MSRFTSGIREAMRPLAKELIKSGLLAFDTISEFVAETGERFKDLVAEAKSEMKVEEQTSTHEPTKDQTDAKAAAR